MTEPTASRAVPALGDGRFLIVNTLGDGGTATVYLAFDMRTEAWVALKALQKRYLNDDEMRRRFSFEAKALELLPHPNIPRLIHYAPDSRPPFMVMELARCGSAMDWVRKHGPMPPVMACNVIRQVSEAVAEAHKHNMIHRDIKPHNVLLDDTGVCKLTDFGIARLEHTTSLTATGSQIGTFSFMAPEQRSDTKTVDHRADVYSLGSSLYTLLTGRTSAELFVAESDDSLMHAVPELLRPIVLRATKYQPDERFSSADELRQAVLETQSDLPPPRPDAPPLVPLLEPLPARPPARIPASRTFPELEGLLPDPDEEQSYHTHPSHSGGWSSLPYTMPDRGPRRLRSADLGPPPALPIRNSTPKSLSREPEPVLAPEPVMPVEPTPALQVTVLLLALVLLVGLFVAGVVGAGAMSVSVAQWSADDKAMALLTTVQREATIVGRTKGNVGVVQDAFQRFQTAPEAERIEAAVAFVGAVDRSERRFEQAALPQVERLRLARDDYLVARQEWARTIDVFPGRIAHGWGVVDGP